MFGCPFSPTATQKFTKELHRQPISVHTTSRTKDHLLASEKRCDHKLRDGEGIQPEGNPENHHYHYLFHRLNID